MQNKNQKLVVQKEIDLEKISGERQLHVLHLAPEKEKTTGFVVWNIFDSTLDLELQEKSFQSRTKAIVYIKNNFEDVNVKVHNVKNKIDYTMIIHEGDVFKVAFSPSIKDTEEYLSELNKIFKDSNALIITNTNRTSIWMRTALPIVAFIVSVIAIVLAII